MEKHSSRKRDRLGPVLDSDPVYLVAALVLMALLVSFYAVLLANMSAVNTQAEDLKEHPYAVTVAADRAETLLMQARTLDDRLAFSREPETIAGVKQEFSSLDQDILRAIDVIGRRHHDADAARELAGRYEEFRAQQRQLVALSSSKADDEVVASFLASTVDPHIDEMLRLDSGIVDAAARSFDQLSATVDETREDAIFTATVLMAVVTASLLLFFLALRRKNRHERELRQSLRRAVESAQDASEAKSRFLSNVSHDIRTPLTAIMGLTDIALEHAGDADRVVGSLNKMKLSSHHLLNLVNDVLDMSKIESGQIDLASRPFDLRAMVETLGSIVRPQADAKRLAFAIELVAVKGSLMVGDEMHVCQILINVLGNAVKYTEPNGNVRLVVEELEGDERRSYAEAHGISLSPTAREGFEEGVRLIRFIVEDDGIGMSKEFMARMFDPFEREDVPARLSVEGTGLGMAIVKNLADLMGGAVEAQSECGRGSRFTVVLPFGECAGGECEALAREPRPVKAVEAARPCVAEDRERRSWEGVHVLLAEDNEIVGEIAEEIIASTGATMERAWNGFDVLDLLEGAPEGRFDLIFMDVQMPGMDGLEATRALVERYREAGRERPPIIATTANAYEEDRRRAFDAGMDGFAVKPIGKNEVGSLLATFVGAKGDE